MAYHKWTDEERAELMAATSGLEGQALREVLQKRGVNSTSWFYKTRRKYGESQVAPAPAVRLTGESFRGASGERKQKMIAEFLTLDKEQKDEWCKAHGANRALVYYHKARIEEKGKLLKKLGRPRKDASEKALAVRAFLNGAESRPPQAYPLHPLPVAQVEGLTLHEAITAMEVKRDHMTEFVEELKRMQRSAR
jgi:hypothetical protein